MNKEDNQGKTFALSPEGSSLATGATLKVYALAKISCGTL
jgi:hypothetical protein